MLVHIFSPKKDKACRPVFFLRNTICDLVLHLFLEGLNISLIYDGRVLFQYLKTAVAMEGSSLSETGKQFIRRF